MSDGRHVHIYVPSDKEKKRLHGLSVHIINDIDACCNNNEEKSFVLKMLIESFEECNGCYIPLDSQPRRKYNEKI